LYIIPNVSVLIVSTEAVNQVLGRKYSQLPREILDFEGDRGIEYISWYYDIDPDHPLYVQFTRTTPARARKLYYNDYEKPTPSNPYFYTVAHFRDFTPFCVPKTKIAKHPARAVTNTIPTSIIKVHISFFWVCEAGGDSTLKQVSSHIFKK